jgi:hypothetical protein
MRTRMASNLLERGRSAYLRVANVSINETKRNEITHNPKQAENWKQEHFIISFH